ncbi:hypothetical protein V6Z12_A10G013700 [Gossypium hirsutum]
MIFLVVWSLYISRLLGCKRGKDMHGTWTDVVAFRLFLVCSKKGLRRYVAFHAW